MYGVSKITSEQNIMLTTFPGAQYSAKSLAEHLDVFARAGIVVDMICQSAPRGEAVDFSFTTSYANFAAVMNCHTPPPRIGDFTMDGFLDVHWFYCSELGTLYGEVI